MSSRYQSYVFYSYHHLTGESVRAFVGWATESGTSMVNEINDEELENYEDVKQNNKCKLNQKIREPLKYFFIILLA